ncbi:uncharacterized protein METZ01_LOCUS369125 [marine metagenome]|uniref:Uncharacterized protein n=1 Tax=marine metagenome TaxID=408172 RepID=A0A382T4R5_9ZZZZ
MADNATLLHWQIRKIASTLFSTPDNAWEILTRNTETDASSYYVTLPSDINKPTEHGADLDYDLKREKFDAFKKWRDLGETSAGKIYDPDIAANYPTLFEYWESELYVYPPIITGLDADYILINIAAEKLDAENVIPMYTLRQNGGDETKAFWFLKIAGLPILDYYNRGLDSYKDKFWNETLLGKLIPFTVLVYVDPANPEIQSETFKQGYIPIYVRDIKFPANGDGPFQLVYVSPSFERDNSGPLTGAFIYKINKEYNPNQ